MKNNLINKNMLNPIGVYDSNYEFDRLSAVNLDIIFYFLNWMFLFPVSSFNCFLFIIKTMY